MKHRASQAGDRTNIVHQDVPRGFFNHLPWNRIELLDVSVNQRMFAEKIHHAWNAARIIMNGVHGFGGEDGPVFGSRDAQPVCNVAVSFGQGKR